MQIVDTLISSRWIVPVKPEGLVLENHSIAIHNGRIVALLPTDDIQTHYQAAHNHHLQNHILIPGLINTHCHAAMSLLRGMADDMALMDWLQNRIWPAETQFVDEQFVKDGTRLAIAEMLRGGTTCFADMYFFPNAIAQVAQETGIRAAIGLVVLDSSTAWAASADEYISKGLALHDELKNTPLISTLFAPHAPYTVSDAPLQKILTYADELDIPIQSHLHETAFEVREAIEKNGISPLHRFQQLGLLSPAFMAVHMTQLEAADIDIVATSGSHIVHCPSSNLKLASGFSPIQALTTAGVNIALGTDGAASNNDLDMFAEMQLAALLAKGISCNAQAIPATKALSMATINGATALGLANDTGSLEIGKAADITAVEVNALNMQPMYNPISHLVYSTHSEQVSDVWINGKQVLHNKQLTTIDQQAVMQSAQQWRQRIDSP